MSSKKALSLVTFFSVLLTVLVSCFLYTSYNRTQTLTASLEETVLNDITTLEQYLAQGENHTFQKWSEFLKLNELREAIAVESRNGHRRITVFLSQVEHSAGVQNHPPILALGDSVRLLNEVRNSAPVLSSSVSQVPGFLAVHSSRHEPLFVAEVTPALEAKIPTSVSSQSVSSSQTLEVPASIEMVPFEAVSIKTTPEMVAPESQPQPKKFSVIEILNRPDPKVTSANSVTSEIQLVSYPETSPNSYAVMPIAATDNSVQLAQGENFPKLPDLPASISPVEDKEACEQAAQFPQNPQSSTDPQAEVEIFSKTEPTLVVEPEPAEEVLQSEIAATSNLPGLPLYAVSVLEKVENQHAKTVLSQLPKDGCPSSAFLSLAQSWSDSSAKFHLPVSTDTARSHQELIASARSLESFLNRASQENAAKWKRALAWDRLESELQAGKEVQIGNLAIVFGRLSSGAYGLELEPFANLRAAIQNYVTARAIQQNPEAAEKLYVEMTNRLALLLILANENPNADVQRAVESSLRWMTWMGQNPELVAKTAALWKQSNVVLDVRPQVFSNLVAGEIEREDAIREQVNNAYVVGKSKFVGKLNIFPCNNDRQIELELQLDGGAYGQSHAYAGPAIVANRSTSHIFVTKKVYIDSNGISTKPAKATIATNSRILGVQDKYNRPVMQRIISRRAQSQKPETEAAANQRGVARVQRQMDESLDPALEKLNDQMAHNVQAQLTPRGLTPVETSMWSDEVGVHVKSAFSWRSGLMAAQPEPEFPHESDLYFAIHESAIQNLASGFFSGMNLNESARRQFRATAPEWIAKAAEGTEKEEEDAGWSMSFANFTPIAVSFEQGRVIFTVHCTQITSDEKDYPAIDITVPYRIEPRDGKCFLVLDKKIEMLPPGFNPKVQKRLSNQTVSLRRVLSRRLKEVFPESYELKPFEVSSGKMSVEGKARAKILASPEFVQSKDGWLQVGLRVERLESEPEAVVE